MLYRLVPRKDIVQGSIHLSNGISYDAELDFMDGDEDNVYVSVLIHGKGMMRLRYEDIYLESMDRHYAAVLLRYNRYRRDDHLPFIYKSPDPIEVGKAIDYAINKLRG